MYNSVYFFYIYSIVILLNISKTIVVFFFYLSINLSTDLGVVTQGQIQFFTNNVIDKTVDVPLGRMIAMAYDSIKKDLYVRANNNEFGGVFRIKTTGDRAYAAVEPIVGSKSGNFFFLYALVIQYNTVSSFFLLKKIYNQSSICDGGGVGGKCTVAVNQLVQLTFSPLKGNRC